MGVNIGATGVCKLCVSHKDIDYFLKKDSIPIWYLNGKLQFHVPDELKCLTMAEKMLIQ